jgi:hypothetical protein
MIKFYSDKHDYIDEVGSLTSVTTVLKKLDPTDWDEVKAKYAKKNNLSLEEVTQKWAKQADGGSKVHYVFEKHTIDTESNVFVHNEEDGVKIGKDLSELTAGVYPELMLYSNRFRVAGQSDLVKIFEDRTFEILDFKTDRVLSFESFKMFDPQIKRRVGKYFKEPISHLELCNFNKYCLQLSVYALMLEQFNFKLRSGEDALKIKHVTTMRDELGDHILDNDGNPIIVKVEEYNIPYLKNEAINILNYFKENLHGK